jgi:hypothetical protein
MAPPAGVGSPSPLAPEASTTNGGWQGGLQRSSDLAGQVANAPANLADTYGYQAPQIGQTQLPDAVQGNVPQLGSAQTYNPANYNPASVGQAPSYNALTGQAATIDPNSGRTYAPTTFGGASLGDARSYDPTLINAPSLGPAGQMGGVNIGPAAQSAGALIGPAAQAAGATIGGSQQAMGGSSQGYGYEAAMNGYVPQAQAQQAQSTDASGLISKFYNPYEKRVIDSALADNSAQADRVRAQQMAAGAAGGAFGGSRFGIAQAQTEGELQRARDSLDAGLRSQGFNTALGAAQQQAGQDSQISGLNAQLGTGVSQSNARNSLENAWSNQKASNDAGALFATNRTQSSIANAGNQTQASVANAQESGATARAQGQLDASRNQFNAGEINTNARQQGQLDATNNQFNAGEINSNARQQGLIDADIGKFNVDQRNSQDRYGADMGLRTAMGNQAATNGAREFGAASGNQFDLARSGYSQAAGLQGAGLLSDASRYASDVGNQFGLANLGNEQGMRIANLGYGNQALGDNARMAGQYGLTGAGFGQEAGMRGADAQTQANRDTAGYGNQFALSQFGANADAASQYAGARNQYGLAGYNGQLQTNLSQAGLYADAARFGADALNTGGRFNATQRDNQLGRQLQSAGLYGDLANSYGSNQRGDIGLQGELGAQQRGIQQDYLNAPYSQLSMLGNLYRNGAPLIGQSMTENGTQNSTGTQTQSMGMGSMLAGLAGAGLSGWASGGFALSDPALKTDVNRIGDTVHGLGLYNYRYHWDEPDRVRTGVMADEVEDRAPHALGPIVKGFRTVDYGKLGLSHLVEA